MIWPFRSKTQRSRDDTVFGVSFNLPNIPSLTMFLILVFVILPAFCVFLYFWSYLLGFWSDKLSEYAPFMKNTELDGNFLKSVTQTEDRIAKISSYEKLDDKTVYQSCNEGSFYCALPSPLNNKTTILPRTKRCDGKPDCLDLSDEINCTKCLTSFSCPTEDGKHFNCLSGDKICDRVADCFDKSDELLYCNREKCAEDEFKCKVKNGDEACFPSKFRCDGEDHCMYGEEELDCEFCQGVARLCDVTEMMKCMPISNLCEKLNVCPNHFDQGFFHCNSTKTCPGSCHLVGVDDVRDEITHSGLMMDWNVNITNDYTSKLHCSDGKWYPPIYVCNGNHPQCNGICKSCLPGAFLCVNEKKCIPIAKLNDGVKDCADGTDELNTTLNVNCNHDSNRCDGFKHCFDGIDEENCTECFSEYGRFVNFERSHYNKLNEDDKKVYMSYINGSREWINNKRAYHCKTEKRCIPVEKRCDGREDCSDGQDEEDCSCAECFMHPYDMCVCRDRNRCFRYNEVCDENFGSKCPNAAQIDKEHCELLRWKFTKL